MKSRWSWTVLVGVLLALGGYTLYYLFLHDWRGTFQADQLHLAAQVQGSTLTLTMQNAGDTDLMVWEGPVAGGPFDISLQTPAGAALRPAAGAPAADAGKALPLKRGVQRFWRADLRALFPEAPPGRYTLRAAYDPAAAAERREPCAAELTLGRVEAEPASIVLLPGR